MKGNVKVKGAKDKRRKYLSFKGMTPKTEGKHAPKDDNVVVVLNA